MEASRAGVRWLFFGALGLTLSFVACGKVGGLEPRDVGVLDAGRLPDGGRPPDGGVPGPDGGGPIIEVPPYDWVGVIGTGQSLSVGVKGAPVIGTTQPFHNLKLADNGGSPYYPLDAGSLSRYAVVDLAEPIRRQLPGSGPGYGDGQYPDNIYGETPHSAMAKQLSSTFMDRTGRDYVTVHTVVGWSGHPLSDINLDGGKRAYPASLMEASVLHGLAQEAHKSYGVGAIVLTHGEADAANPNYGSGLGIFIQQYNRDLKAITGQSADIPLIVSQQSVSTGLNTSNIQVWKAGLQNPLILCSGPKYQYGYASDFLHLPAAGYRRLGEKYAEIFDLVVNQRKSWAPLQPRTAERSGNKVVVTFDVPSPPLSWDPNMESPHQSQHTEWAKGRGFEVSLASTQAPLTVSSVDLTSERQVTLTLSATPTGPVRVAYALTQDGSGDQGGLVSGFRGALRDADGFVGADEESFTATVTRGSPNVTLSGTGLSDRAVRDVVTGPGAPADWAIQTLSSATNWTMYGPWTGASGTVTLKVHHDQHNYAVHSWLTTQ